MDQVNGVFDLGVHRACLHGVWVEYIELAPLTCAKGTLNDTGDLGGAPCLPPRYMVKYIGLVFLTCAKGTLPPKDARCSPVDPVMAFPLSGSAL